MPQEFLPAKSDFYWDEEKEQYVGTSFPEKSICWSYSTVICYKTILFDLVASKKFKKEYKDNAMKFLLNGNIYVVFEDGVITGYAKKLCRKMKNQNIGLYYLLPFLLSYDGDTKIKNEFIPTTIKGIEIALNNNKVDEYYVSEVREYLETLLNTLKFCEKNQLDLAIC